MEYTRGNKKSFNETQVGYGNYQFIHIVCLPCIFANILNLLTFKLEAIISPSMKYGKLFKKKRRIREIWKVVSYGNYQLIHNNLSSLYLSKHINLLDCYKI